jgi:PKD repeat protein
VKVTFKATTDKDDENLTYNVYRSGTAQPIYTQVVRSRFWDIPTLTFSDTNLAPGSQAAYRVEASDGVVAVQSFWTPFITVASQHASYPDMVKGDGAGSYWRYEETSGTTAADSVGSNTGTYRTMTLGQPGMMPGTAAAGLATGSSSMVSTTLQTNPQTFSLESWIKTTTVLGGRIVGFGSSRTGTSGSFDRHIYMRNDGKVTFGVFSGSTVTVTSNAALNDGKWHHLVATMAPGRSELFVDGVSQGTNTPAAASVYNGYWRVGSDNLSGWPSRPTSGAMIGSIDEVAVYPVQLAQSDVQWHYSAGSANKPPVASFSSDCTALNCEYDARASSDPDGTVAGYAWNFGDGQTGTGATPSHTYGAGGTYQVRLTVTDNLGATAVVTNAVTVTAPNGTPVADMAVSCTGFACSYDGSGSSDADGTISSWAWDFGDGQTGTGKTTTHTYAAAGNYVVKLVVTDDKGGSGTASTNLTVTVAAAGTVLAKDTFARVLAQGLGSADVGGAWTISGSASRYSVSGGVGNWIMPAPGNAPAAYLKNVQAADTDLSFTVSLDKNATGGGVYLSAIGRSVVNQGEYRAKVRFTSTAKVYLAIVRLTAAGTETYLTAETPIAGLTGTNGEQVGVRIQVTGQGTTAIKSKVWAANGAEPAAWQLEVTDSTAGFQAPGYTGILAQLSGSATNAPVTARVSNYTLTTPR